MPSFSARPTSLNFAAALCLAMTVAPSASVANTVSAVSSSVTVTANARFTNALVPGGPAQPGVVTDNGFGSQGQNATLNQLTATAEATLEAINPTTSSEMTARAAGTTTASFNSASSGLVTFTDFTLFSFNVNAGSLGVTSVNDGFIYSFTAANPGAISFSYGTALDPSTTTQSGAGALTLAVNAAVTGDTIGEVGTAEIAFGAGLNTLEISVGPNVSGGLQTRTTIFDGTVSWTISETAPVVPLPAGALLLLSGIAGLAFARRFRA